MKEMTLASERLPPVTIAQRTPAQFPQQIGSKRVRMEVKLESLCEENENDRKLESTKKMQAFLERATTHQTVSIRQPNPIFIYVGAGVMVVGPSKGRSGTEPDVSGGGTH